MEDMTGNRYGEPSVSGRGRCFLATRHQIVKCMLTSIHKERRCRLRQSKRVPYLSRAVQSFII